MIYNITVTVIICEYNKIKKAKGPAKINEISLLMVVHFSYDLSLSVLWPPYRGREELSRYHLEQHTEKLLSASHCGSQSVVHHTTH